MLIENNRNKIIYLLFQVRLLKMFLLNEDSIPNIFRRKRDIKKNAEWNFIVFLQAESFLLSIIDLNISLIFSYQTHFSCEQSMPGNRCHWDFQLSFDIPIFWRGGGLLGVVKHWQLWLYWYRKDALKGVFWKKKSDEA